MCLKNSQNVQIPELNAYKLFTFHDGRVYNAFANAVWKNNVMVPAPLKFENNSLIKAEEDDFYHALLNEADAHDIINSENWGLYAFNLKNSFVFFAKIQAQDVIKLGALQTGITPYYASIACKRYVVKKIQAVYDCNRIDMFSVKKTLYAGQDIYNSINNILGLKEVACV